MDAENIGGVHAARFPAASLDHGVKRFNNQFILCMLSVEEQYFVSDNQYKGNRNLLRMKALMVAS